jgi:transposase
MDLSTAHAIIGLLLPLCEQLSDRVVEQDQQIQALTLRVKQLEDQLATNSKNSSKPPSSDGLKSPKDRSSRGSSDKKAGGQKGHPGKGGQLSEDPDETFRFSVDQCPDCQVDLRQQALDDLIRKQLIDIPPVVPHVTEYQIELKTCPCCGKQWQAEGCPAGIYHELEYGPGVKAISVYLSAYQYLPIKRTKELLQGILGLKLSSGSLDNFRKSAAAQLSGFMEELKQTITQAGAAFFDETGMKVAKQRFWSHIAATKLHSLFSLHPKRGGEVHEHIGILPGFTGIAHHDALPAYNRFEQATHSLCCAHVLRELTFAVERNGQAEWAEPMIQLLLSIKSSVAKSPTRTVDLRWQGRYRKRYEELVAIGLAANPPTLKADSTKRGKAKQTKTHNLLIRLQDRQVDYLRFMTHAEAEFDNNQAERDLRMNKVKMKVSGCFRSLVAGQEFMAIRSLVATAVKQGCDPIQVLRQVFTHGDSKYMALAKYPD